MLLQPLPGVHSDQLLEMLERERLALSNMRGVAGPVTDLYNAYIAWCLDAVGRLRHLLSNDDLDRLVMTPRYWLLQSLPNDHHALRSVIDLELVERASAFEAAAQTLSTEMARWSSASVLVVADTSVYISDPEKVENLPFSQRLDLRHEPVLLLVPILVIDELDKLKQASKPHVRWRARHTLAELDRAVGQGSRGRLQAGSSVTDSSDHPRGEVTVEVVLDPPGHRRLPINDDEIIDRAMAIAAIAGRPVRLLTYDTGMSTRGRLLGLAVTKLEEPPVDEPSLPVPNARKA